LSRAPEGAGEQAPHDRQQHTHRDITLPAIGRLVVRLWKKVAMGALATFAAIQLVTFERTNPPVTGDIRVAADVKAVLERGCYDCHSNASTWPWYSRVAPVSWLIHRDVTLGRQKLNFSAWETLPAARQAKKRIEVGEEITSGEMPPWFYTPLHPRAALSTADKQLLQTWAAGGTGPLDRGEGASTK
jgi:cytochrome c551/c552